MKAMGHVFKYGDNVDKKDGVTIRSPLGFGLGYNLYYAIDILITLKYNK